MIKSSREQIADKLRHTMFTGASPWSSCSNDVKDRWLHGADYVLGLIARARDDAFRKSAQTLHEQGDFNGAKVIRELRRADEEEHQ